MDSHRGYNSAKTRSTPLRGLMTTTDLATLKYGCVAVGGYPRFGGNPKENNQFRGSPGRRHTPTHMWSCLFFRVPVLWLLTGKRKERPGVVLYGCCSRVLKGPGELEWGYSRCSNITFTLAMERNRGSLQSNYCCSSRYLPTDAVDP